MTTRRPPLRRLVPGLVALHPDLGKRLLEARKGRKGHDFGHKQEWLAHAAGISRSTLSRIEKGHVVPRMDTLERLMEALNLDMAEVGFTEERLKQEPLSPESDEAEKREEEDRSLGARLREQRRKLHLTIAQVAVAAGLDPSQISRVERGQLRRSRMVEWYVPDGDFHKDYRRRVFVNEVLDDLADGVWRPDRGRRDAEEA